MRHADHISRSASRILIPCAQIRRYEQAEPVRLNPKAAIGVLALICTLLVALPNVAFGADFGPSEEARAAANAKPNYGVPL